MSVAGHSAEVCARMFRRAGSVYSASRFESTSSLHPRVPSTTHCAVDGTRENYEARCQVFVSTELMRPVLSRSSSDAARAS